METKTVQEIIKVIDAKLDSLTKDYEEGMSDDEYHSRTSELGELKNDLKAMIKKEE